MQLPGEGGLGEVLPFHRGPKLPRDDSLDGVLGRFLEEPLSLEEIFEARTKMRPSISLTGRKPPRLPGPRAQQCAASDDPGTLVRALHDLARDTRQLHRPNRLGLGLGLAHFLQLGLGCIAFIRRVANSNSPFGAFRVVLKKAWSPTIVSSWTQNNNRPSRCPFANGTRNSCSPSPMGRHNGIPRGQPI